MSVLSFDNNKVRIDLSRGIVKKYTSNLEYEQIKLATEYLNRNRLVLKCGIKVRVAPILEWSGAELTLHLCKGLNLEDILKFHKHKKIWIEIIKELLELFSMVGFLWNDVAPRNMIFDNSSLTIYIFDFEKKLIVNDFSMKKENFSSFFRRYAYEEFSCFLNKKDQSRLFNDYLFENIEGEIRTRDIGSNRKRLLLSSNFGSKECYSISEINLIEDIMSDIATPFMVGNAIIYPMYDIEKIIKKGGYNEYSKLIKQLSNCSTGSERLYILKKFSD